MINIQNRCSLRGLKKCIGCQRYNGIRVKYCKNKNCVLAMDINTKLAKSQKTMDAVQLISSTDSKMYSVRVRDRGPFSRNFVKITDKTIQDDNNGSVIINRIAICYVDTCKYDPNNLSISCKHTRNASECVQQATVLPIKKNILFQMEYFNENKIKLWDLYNEYELITPIVQQISQTVFVVKCNENALFPAGLLHVSLNSKAETKCICSCKKMQISLLSNEIIMKRDNCDHIFLVIAAIMSDDNLKNVFSDFTNIFLINLNTLKFLNDDNDGRNSLDADESFSSFSQNILNTSDSLSLNHSSTKENDTVFDSEINLMNSTNDIVDMEGISMDLVNDFVTNNNNNSNNIEDLELSECQIELMDQFKLTDQIDLCQSQIELTDTDLLNDTNIICSNFVDIDNRIISDSELIHTNNISQDINNMIATTTITELEQGNSSYNNQKTLPSLVQINQIDKSIPPTLDYYCWLDSVIEKINNSMNMNGNGKVSLLFSVHHTFFDLFEKSFSIGVKKRLPNFTEYLKSEEYSGLIKHTWKFYQIQLLKRIFQTENNHLEIERIFIEHKSGIFTIMTEDLDEKILNEYNLKNCKQKLHYRIKPSVLKTFLKIGNPKRTDLDLTGLFIIEWIPNVLPKSKFGDLRFIFNYGFKKNNRIIKRK